MNEEETDEKTLTTDPPVLAADAGAAPPVIELREEPGGQGEVHQGVP